MSSRRHAVPAMHRSARPPAGVRAAPAHEFQNDPLTAWRLLSQIRAPLGGAWQLIGEWRQRSRDRAVLRSMSHREISDFCPRQAEAEEEMNKPFWRA